MRKKRRINMSVDEELFDQIKKIADASHLMVGTYTRLCVIEALKNNINIKLNYYGKKI